MNTPATNRLLAFCDALVVGQLKDTANAPNLCAYVALAREEGKTNARNTQSKAVAQIAASMERAVDNTPYGESERIRDKAVKWARQLRKTLGTNNVKGAK